ncbi:MAG: integrin alpha [Candidatus Sumerlaeota bacterium]|nr:integrin alpha [Candidatus Sumerlaeota bacterium]
MGILPAVIGRRTRIGLDAGQSHRLASANWTYGGPDVGQYGVSIAPAGDVNGDGISDVIVGCPSYTPDGNRAGDRKG